MSAFRLLTAALVLAFSWASVEARLPKLRKSSPTAERYDTVRSAHLRFAGYDKPNAAQRETFFVTNLDSVAIDGFAVELEYFDAADRQLHKRTAVVNENIPGGETRSVAVPTWDCNHAFHYFRSPRPPRRQSAPYSVTIKPLYALRLNL